MSMGLAVGGTIAAVIAAVLLLFASIKGSREAKDERTAIKNDVTDVKNDVTDVKNDVTDVKNDVFSLQNNVTTVQNDVTAVKNAMTQGFERIESLMSPKSQSPMEDPEEQSSEEGTGTGTRLPH